MTDLTSAGQYPNNNGVSIFPGTQFTGPVTAGNVNGSDGTGNLASLGGTVGTANTGYAVMAQSAVVTQATNAGSAGVYLTDIVLPAQSQILRITLMVTTVWSGGTTTLSVGTSAGTTAATSLAAAGVAGGTAGRVTIAPTTTAQIANWDNVSNATFQTGGPQDIRVQLTSANTGTGVGTLTVEYIPGINLAS